LYIYFWRYTTKEARGGLIFERFWCKFALDSQIDSRKRKDVSKMKRRTVALCFILLVGRFVYAQQQEDSRIKKIRSIVTQQVPWASVEVKDHGDFVVIIAYGLVKNIIHNDYDGEYYFGEVSYRNLVRNIAVENTQSIIFDIIKNDVLKDVGVELEISYPYNGGHLKFGVYYDLRRDASQPPLANIRDKAEISQTWEIRKDPYDGGILRFTPRI